MKRFILEKQYEGEWYYEGNYSEDFINSLVQCAFNLGRNGGCYDAVRLRVEEVKDESNIA